MSDESNTSPIGNLGSPNSRRRRGRNGGSVEVTEDDLPTSGRVNVTIDNATQLAKVRKILGLKHFTTVFDHAFKRLVDDLREQGYDL